MKGQILSRIQSYQNIPVNNVMNTSKNTKDKNEQLINQVKFYKYIPNNLKHNTNQQIKLLSPPPKLFGQRCYFGTSVLRSNKKLSNWQKKKSLYFQSKNVSNSKDEKNQRPSKRVSQKYIPQNVANKQFSKQVQNYGNTEQRYLRGSVPRNKNFSSQLLKQVSKNRRKQLLRIYNKYEGNKSTKIIPGSQHIIANSGINDGRDHNNLIISNQITPMMRTVNVFKDYKQSPYFNLSNKKMNIKSSQNIQQNAKINQKIYSTLTSQKNDVSIQIQSDDKYNQQQLPIKQTIQFGCSEIKQACIQNDSQFLDTSQKQIIKQLDELYKKQNKKKKWKKLPNDFLKI